MKIALVVPEGAEYGLDTRTRLLGEALQSLPETQVELIPLLVGRQPTSSYLELGERLNSSEIDVIHLPHEYSIYGGILPKETGFWELRYLLKKPVVMSACNLAPMESLLQSTPLPFSQRVANAIHFRNKSTRDSIEIAPFATAYTIVTTNSERKILIERGAKPEYVTVIPDGVPPSTKEAKQGEYAAFDFFDWRCRWELAQNLANGVPVLAPNTPETEEIWSRRDCIQRYDPKTPGDYEAKLAEILDNKERWATLSAQSHRYAERYSFPKMAVLTRRTYAAAISVF